MTLSPIVQTVAAAIVHPFAGGTAAAMRRDIPHWMRGGATQSAWHPPSPWPELGIWGSTELGGELAEGRAIVAQSAGAHQVSGILDSASNPDCLRDHLRVMRARVYGTLVRAANSRRQLQLGSSSRFSRRILNHLQPDPGRRSRNQFGGTELPELTNGDGNPSGTVAYALGVVASPCESTNFQVGRTSSSIEHVPLRPHASFRTVIPSSEESTITTSHREISWRSE